MNAFPPIVVVYYVYINPLSNWQAIVRGQLTDLKTFGLLEAGDLYVHITNTYGVQGVEELVRRLTGNKAEISRSDVNQFEYPAIKLLHDLTARSPETIFMYLHTKGMGHNTPERIPEEKMILRKTFKHWRRSITVFQNDPRINKIGLFPGKIDGEGEGWIWYNFFIARGSYLGRCEKPALTSDRYYYEGWAASAGRFLQPNDCYSLCSGRIEYFDAAQAMAHASRCEPRGKRFLAKILKAARIST